MDRRLVNKREVKSYQVVYDKRIVLGKGDDTIPFGFNWSPELAEQLLADNKNIPLRSYVSNGSVPDDILYTNIQPFMEDNARLIDIQSMETDKTISSASIDLMESDSEHETSKTTARKIQLIENNKISTLLFKSLINFQSF